ncbi:MAG: PepSY domain-containing protein [Clostridia bacterium]
MKTRHRLWIFVMATTVLLALAGYAIAETHLFPIAPATMTEKTASADDAIALAKDTMSKRQKLTLDDLNRDLQGGKIKANYVELENGENAWMIMIDSEWGTDALVTVSSTGEDVIDYQATDNQLREITTILLKQWRAAKGDMRAWSTEDTALFKWLYGSAEEYIVPSDADIRKEKAADIALAAISREIASPTFTFLFEQLSFTDGRSSQLVWSVTIYENGKELYVVKVSADTGEVVDVFQLSQNG